MLSRNSSQILLSELPVWRSSFASVSWLFETPQRIRSSVLFCLSFDISYSIMDTLSCYTSEFGYFDDEYYQFQTSIDEGFRNNSDSMPYFEEQSQPSYQIFEENYIEGTIPYRYEQSSYPASSSIAGPPPSSTTKTEILVEEFQYIDFDQSHMTEPQASLNVSYPPLRVEEGRDGVYYASLTQKSNAASNSPAPKDKKPSKKEKPAKPPHSRHASHTAPPSSQSVSPREQFSAAELFSNVNSRPTTASKGPPKNLLTVFDSSVDPHIRRRSRSAFSEEGKKSVEAVRRLGACTECRFRKRKASWAQPLPLRYAQLTAVVRH